MSPMSGIDQSATITRRRASEEGENDFAGSDDPNHHSHPRPPFLGGWLEAIGRSHHRQLVTGVLVLLLVSMTWTFANFSVLSGIQEVQDNDNDSDGDSSLSISNDDVLLESSDSDGLDQLSHSNRIQNVLSNSYQSLEIWKKPKSDKYHKCTNRVRKDIINKNTVVSGYILVHASGGLSQIRTGLSDMVAIAKILKAALILPTMDHETDPSDFKDIFNWEHFKSSLKDDVQVLESLPPQFAKRKPLEKDLLPWAKGGYYRGQITSLMKHHKVMKFLNIDSRLANNGHYTAIQRQRCRAMYESLRYAKEIEEFGKVLVKRLRNSNGNDNEPYIALHLRYDQDILASTGCSHNLTSTEIEELDKLRRRSGKEMRNDGEERRRQGGCPMTPRETAVFLQAMGYPSTTRIYLTAGEVYGQEGLKTFRDKFPKTFSYSTLATDEELKPFKHSQHKLEALDYIVALESDVFVYTYDGDMPKAIRGHRVFEGFRKIINPDRRSFVRVLDEMDEVKLPWEKFSSHVKRLQANRIGAPRYRQSGPSPMQEEYFYANPFPGCVCD